MALARVDAAEARYKALLAEGLPPRAAWAAIIDEYVLRPDERDLLRKRICRAGLPTPGGGRPEDPRTTEALTSFALLQDCPPETAGALALERTGIHRTTLRRAMRRRNMGPPVRLEDRRSATGAAEYARAVLARCEELRPSVDLRSPAADWVRLLAMAHAAHAAARILGDATGGNLWEWRLHFARFALRCSDPSHLKDLGGPQALMRDLLGTDPVLEEAWRALFPGARRIVERLGLPIPYIPPVAGDGVIRPSPAWETMSWATVARLHPDWPERRRVTRALLEGPAAKRRLVHRWKAQYSARVRRSQRESREIHPRTDMGHSSRATPAGREAAAVVTHVRNRE